MENLQEGFAELRCALGLPSREMPCRNWRWHRHYSYYYNESTRRLVEKYYAKDIETFGYRFGFPSGILQWAVPERLGIRLGDILSRLGQARMKSGVLSLPLPNSRIGGARIQDLTR